MRDAVARRRRGAYHGAVASRTADPRARPIAVFDSGVGGLTVLHELLVQLPHEDFVYLADTARLPYGTRTQAELERFALQCAEELLARGAKLLVVACNSATAAALPALRERMAQTTLGIDVLGVVQPGAVQAVAATHQRARRAAGHAGHGGQRRVRRGDRPGRPVRRAHGGRRAPTWRRSSRAGSRSTSASSRPCAATSRRCARPASTR